MINDIVKKGGSRKFFFSDSAEMMFLHQIQLGLAVHLAPLFRPWHNYPKAVAEMLERLSTGVEVLVELSFAE